MNVSEVLLKQENEIEMHFKEAMKEVQFGKAQAFATLGLYRALNTMVRMLAHTSEELLHAMSIYFDRAEAKWLQSQLQGWYEMNWAGSNAPSDDPSIQGVTQFSAQERAWC